MLVVCDRSMLRLSSNIRFNIQRECSLYSGYRKAESFGNFKKTEKNQRGQHMWFRDIPFGRTPQCS